MLRLMWEESFTLAIDMFGTSSVAVLNLFKRNMTQPTEAWDFLHLVKDYPSV